MRRIRNTRSGVHWQTANGFVLVELPSEIAEAPAKARAFIRDVEAFAAISRADIARVVDWASDTGESSYVVLDVPTGATLRELAHKTLVPPDVRARIALDVLQAVEAAHVNGAVFGDLDADSVVISERGQVVLLPTCSRARAATLEDDIAAVARLAGVRDGPHTAQSLGDRLRTLGTVAQRETVERFVIGALLTHSTPPPSASLQPPRSRFSVPPPPQTRRAPYTPKPPPPPEPVHLSSPDHDDLTPVIPLDRNRSRAISELSPDDLIPAGLSEPEIPVDVEEPPDPRDSERPVVSEPDIVAFRAAATKSRRVPLMLMATLCVACAIAALLWRGVPTLLPAAALTPHRAPRSVPAVEEQAPPAQPPAGSGEQPATAPTTSAIAEVAEADVAQPSATPAPSKRAPRKRAAAPRRPAKRAAARSSETDEMPKTLESSPYRFVPNEP